VLFDILKFVHILLTVAAVGANITYSIWIQRGMANREALPFALRGVGMLNKRISNPGYGLLLLTGIGMAVVAETSLLTPWLLLSLILWLGLILVGMFGYTPTQRKQIALAESVGADNEEYTSVAWRGTFLGIVAGVSVLVIIFLMVFKPALWG
jgi:uncharacterized membrane protein